MALHFTSTNFKGNFDTNYSSRSVLIRNFRSSMEFDFCGQFLNEKVLCVLYVVKIGTKEHAVVEN